MPIEYHATVNASHADDIPQGRLLRDILKPATILCDCFYAVVLFFHVDKLVEQEVLHEATRVHYPTRRHLSRLALRCARAAARTGAVTLEAISCALNERGVRPARGARWYASSVANLLSRAQKNAAARTEAAVI